eukprot:1561004-Rhodomonas_salina.1
MEFTGDAAPPPSGPPFLLGDSTADSFLPNKPCTLCSVPIDCVRDQPPNGDVPKTSEMPVSDARRAAWRWLRFASSAFATCMTESLSVSMPSAHDSEFSSSSDRSACVRANMSATSGMCRIVVSVATVNSSGVCRPAPSLRVSVESPHECSKMPERY